jgi:hypothetical protein
MKAPVRIASLLLLGASLACNTFAAPPAPTLAPPPTVTPAPPPTATPLPPTAVPTPIPTETPAVDPYGDLYIGPGDVVVHPEPEVYAGDRVSFEVFVHDGANLGLSRFPVAVYLGDPVTGQLLSTADVYPSGLGRRLQATFTWTWYTDVFEGEQTVTVVVDPENEIILGDENPDNNSLTFTVNILPRVALAPLHSDAHWVTASTDCCIFNYISGSPAERDIEMIKATAEKAVGFVEERLGHSLQQRIVFNLIDRLLGHGGFASSSVTITYIDRDYAGGGLENVFRHEATHILNRHFGPLRPAIIEEGAATYIAGGHFKEEPFAPRMLGVIEMGDYIPLTDLANGFYASQHEIGYLESASLIEYLVDTYGWERFTTFMRAFQSAESDSVVLDKALRLIYEETLAEVETDWLAWLHAQADDARWRADIDYTVQYYDTVRRYQQIEDPSAYFLYAWIPDINRAVRMNIVADYSRHPDTATNIALESMLIEVSHAINTGDFVTAQQYLDSVNAVLDSESRFDVDMLASDYWNLTESALQAGYEPHRIQLTADTATLTVSQSDLSTALSQIVLTRSGNTWRLN